MNFNVLLLALSQAVMMTTMSLSLASSAVVGAQLAPLNLATIPLAIQYLATMLMLFPVARLMQYFDRRLIFCMGALLGAMGLIAAAIAIKLGSFVLFAAAGFLIGIFGAVGQYYRFAAVDSVPAEQKNYAISLTLTGGLIAAFLGPRLALWTKDLWAPTFYASFLALAGIALFAAICALGLKIPPLTQVEEQQAKRTWSEISKNSKFVVAVLGGVLGYAVMNLLMKATPLAMMQSNFSFAETASVIQWHLVAMFAPSFFSGALIQKIGILPVMLLGCLFNLAGIAVNLSGAELLHFELSLILLGIGWNFLYVGATSLLIEGSRKNEAARVQALNDSLVFLGVTIVTMLSATLVNVLGWQAVNLYASLAVLLVSASLVWLMRQPRSLE